MADRTEQVLTRAGGRVEVVASLHQGRTAAAQCGLFTIKSSRSYLNHLVHNSFGRHLSLFDHNDGDTTLFWNFSNYQSKRRSISKDLDFYL